MFAMRRLADDRAAPVLLLAVGLCVTPAAHGDGNAGINDQFSAAVAYGDFNGDGYQDVAAGAWLDDVGGVVEAGAVDVIYGAAGGLDRANRQFWNEEVVDIEGAAETANRFGWSLASADFNADGYDDLAIGTPGARINGWRDAGAVNVIYGSPSGLSATFVSDQRWTQDSADVEDTAEELDGFGSSLATADFNADGYPDLAIGVPCEDLSTQNCAGEVNVLYGSVSGLSATAVRDQRWNQDSNNVEDVVEALDSFGCAVATGDFNGDGYDDLAIGAYGESVNGVFYAGAVNVIYGSDSGLSATAVPDQRWSQDSPDVEDAAETYDSFGWSIAAGDFNADGYADLAIGVPREALSAKVEAGAVDVIYGSASGLSATAPVRDQRWTQDARDVEDVVEMNDQFGKSLAIADFNADGYDDLAIGAPGESVDAKSMAGSVNVIYGAASGLSATFVADQRWNQNAADVEDVAESGDLLGSSLTAADFNADGYADLVVGARAENLVCWSGPIEAAGAFNVLYGSTPGLSATAVPDQFWSQPCP